MLFQELDNYITLHNKQDKIAAAKDAISAHGIAYSNFFTFVPEKYIVET